jgi:plasmid stabilization system protein ParE
VTLSVRFTNRAAAEIERADAWWRENRPAVPRAIRDDLASLLELLSAQPEMGRPVENAKLVGTRRIQLDRVQYHVYYRVGGEGLVVLAFWQAQHGEKPRI